MGRMKISFLNEYESWNVCNQFLVSSVLVCLLYYCVYMARNTERCVPMKIVFVAFSVVTVLEIVAKIRPQSAVCLYGTFSMIKTWARPQRSERGKNPIWITASRSLNRSLQLSAILEE